MKKFASLILALAMMFSLSISASAATINTSTGTSSDEVKINIIAGEDQAIVYKVDITWKDLTFTYSNSKAAQWNPDDHAYNIGGVNAGWDNTSIADAITVANHSNATITVDSVVTPYTDNNRGIEVTCTTTDSTILEKPVEGSAQSEAPCAKFTVALKNPKEEPDDESATTGLKIAQIAINISAT